MVHLGKVSVFFLKRGVLDNKLCYNEGRGKVVACMVPTFSASVGLFLKRKVFITMSYREYIRLVQSWLSQLFKVVTLWY